MPFLKKLHAWCNKHEWSIILVGLVVLLRIPTLFTPHYYGDEEIYFVMGRAWRTGIPMYQAMFDHKPPLIYILAGITQSVFWFRTALLLVMAVHTLLFARLAKLFWQPIRPKLAYVSTLIFVILTTIPTFEGNIVNAELLMMLPITAALLMVWDATGEGKLRPYKYLLAGLVAGIGWLFKVPVMFDFVALALFLFAFTKKKTRESLKNILSLNFLMFGVGFVLPLASTFVYYYLKGNGPAYLDTVLTMNLGYVSSWSTSAYQFNPFKSGLLSRATIVLAITLILYGLRNKLNNRLVLAGLWLTFSFFGSLLSGRPYPHYLQEPFVPLALFAPFILATQTVAGWTAMAVIIIWGALTVKQIGFWGYPLWPIYTNFAKVITSQINCQGYANSFDGVKRNYAVGNYLNARLNPGDKLYVWGSDAAIYNITNTLPAGGKYIVDFHVRDLNKYDYVIDNLEKNQPKYIVILPKAIEFPQLNQLIGNKYIEINKIDGVEIYMRIEQ